MKNIFFFSTVTAKINAKRYEKKKSVSTALIVKALKHDQVMAVLTFSLRKTRHVHSGSKIGENSLCESIRPNPESAGEVQLIRVQKAMSLATLK